MQLQRVLSPDRKSPQDMAATITMMESQAPHAGAFSACPHCGTDLPELESVSLAEAQRQIQDLQAQVRMLSQKATAAGESPCLLIWHSQMANILILP